jgi:hypothetical protein
MAAKTQAIVRGTDGGRSLEGRHRGYCLAYRPVRHPDAEGGWQLAELARVLSVTIHLDAGKDDTSAARTALDALMDRVVELRLADLVFRGWITRASFRQEADSRGRATGAIVELRIKESKSEARP